MDNLSAGRNVSSRNPCVSSHSVSWTGVQPFLVLPRLHTPLNGRPPLPRHCEWWKLAWFSVFMREADAMPINRNHEFIRGLLHPPPSPSVCHNGNATSVSVACSLFFCSLFRGVRRAAKQPATRTWLGSLLVRQHRALTPKPKWSPKPAPHAHIKHTNTNGGGGRPGRPSCSCRLPLPLPQLAA
jgi:hypothetical protein